MKITGWLSVCLTLMVGLLTLGGAGVQAQQTYPMGPMLAASGTVGPHMQPGLRGTGPMGPNTDPATIMGPGSMHGAAGGAGSMSTPRTHMGPRVTGPMHTGPTGTATPGAMGPRQMGPFTGSGTTGPAMNGPLGPMGPGRMGPAGPMFKR